MKTFAFFALALHLLIGNAFAGSLQDTDITKSISANLRQAKTYSKFATILSLSPKAEELKKKGPFTVFVPNDGAFKNHPEATEQYLNEAGNAEDLSKFLDAHIVKGEYDFETLSKVIKEGKGKAVLQTLGGKSITATMKTEHSFTLTAEGNAKASTVEAGSFSSNGVIVLIDGFLAGK